VSIVTLGGTLPEEAEDPLHFPVEPEVFVGDAVENPAHFGMTEVPGLLGPPAVCTGVVFVVVQPVLDHFQELLAVGQTTRRRCDLRLTMPMFMLVRVFMFVMILLRVAVPMRVVMFMAVVRFVVSVMPMVVAVSMVVVVVAVVHDRILLLAIDPRACPVLASLPGKEGEQMIPYPNIDPELFSIGPIKIRWYGLMYVLGFLGAYLLIPRQKRSREIGLQGAVAQDLIFYLALGLIVGARLGYILFYQFNNCA